MMLTSRQVVDARYRKVFVELLHVASHPISRHNGKVMGQINRRQFWRVFILRCLSFRWLAIGVFDLQVGVLLVAV